MSENPYESPRAIGTPAPDWRDAVNGFNTMTPRDVFIKDASLAVYSVLLALFSGVGMAAAISRMNYMNIAVSGFFLFAQLVLAAWQVAQAVAGAKRL